MQEKERTAPAIQGMRRAICKAGREELRPAVAEQHRRDHIGAGANEEVEEPGDDRAGGADEVMVGVRGERGVRDDRHPGGDIARLIGNQREKEQRPEPEEGQADHLPDHLVLLLACHVGIDSSG